jgi:hypothetical protein
MLWWGNVSKNRRWRRYDDRQRQSTINATQNHTLNPGLWLRLFRNLSLMATGGFMVAAMLLGLGVWRIGGNVLSGVQEMFTIELPEPEVDVRSLVIQQVRGASELTTAVFAMQAVVPTSRDRTLGGYTIGKTTLLYIAYGEVRAGVNLADLAPEDVQVLDDTIRLRLPAPEILDSKIDVTRSTVYDYDRGFLGLGPDVAPELQTLAQQQTLQQVVQAACDQGILAQANQRAEAAVTQLLTTAGYENIVIETQPATTVACPVPTVAPAEMPPAEMAPAEVTPTDLSVPPPPAAN